MIALLIDENVPKASVAWLREQGYDALSILEQHSGASDDRIAAFSAETGRLVVTFDRDFGELIFHKRIRSPAGVVPLRFVPAFPTEPGQLLHQLISRQSDQLKGNLTSMDRPHARQRRLPSG